MPRDPHTGEHISWVELERRRARRALHQIEPTLIPQPTPPPQQTVQFTWNPIDAEAAIRHAMAHIPPVQPLTPEDDTDDDGWPEDDPAPAPGLRPPPAFGDNITATTVQEEDLPLIEQLQSKKAGLDYAVTHTQYEGDKIDDLYPKRRANSKQENQKRDAWIEGYKIGIRANKERNKQQAAKLP